MPSMPPPRALLASVVTLVVALTTGSSHADDGSVGPPHTMTAYDPSKPCTGTGPTPATGWCSYYDGATVGTGGRNVALSTSVCRLPGLPTATLAADDGEQADFAVGVDGNPPSWTWSADKTFTDDASYVDVPGGTCVQWTVTWGVADDAGNPLAPGAYYLSADPLMDPTDLPATVDLDNPQTFTVR